MVRRIVYLLLVLLVLAILSGIRPDHSAAEVEARWATPPSKFVEVDGMRVHVRDRGAGPTLVLIHGSNSSLFTWEGWTRELSGDHRVVAMDLPGHGLTGPNPSGRYAPADMAEVVDHVVTKLGLDHFVLAGNSMGGHVALAYTLAHPGRVEKLILVDSGGIPREEPPPLAFRLAGMPVVSSLTRWLTPRFFIAKSVRDTFGDPSKVTDALIDRVYDLNLRDGNREATRARFSAPVDVETARHLGELRLPVLILWGTRDHWILPRYGERLRDAIPGARLEMLEGLGHTPMEEDPVASVRPVKAFL